MSLSNWSVRVPVLGLAAICAVLAVPAQAELVAHYKFNEGSGTTAADATGKGHTGTLNGRSSSGAVGNLPIWKLDAPAGASDPYSLEFEGRLGQAWVDMGASSNVFQNVSEWTIAAWIKPDSFSTPFPTGYDNAVFVSIGDHAGDLRQMVEKQADSRGSLAVGGASSPTTGGYLRAGGRSDEYSSTLEKFYARSSDAIVAAGQWTHIAATVDIPSDLIKLYINGVEVASQPFGTPPSDGFRAGTTPNIGSVSAYIGQRPDGGERFDGNIDDVRFYNDALSAGEIAQIALVPEPGTLGLLGLGAIGLLARRRRR